MQVEGLRYKVPEIVGAAVAFVAVIMLLLSIVYGVRRRSYSIKSQRSPLDVSRLFNKYILLFWIRLTVNQFLTSLVFAFIIILYILKLITRI